jgi:hypothetical protein
MEKGESTIKRIVETLELEEFSLVARFAGNVILLIVIGTINSQTTKHLVAQVSVSRTNYS